LLISHVMRTTNPKIIANYADRLALRQRPEGQPLMHQNWGKLLFLHWPINEKLLRPLIPNRLTIDLFEDSAWLGITPFSMWDVRALPPFAPAIPGLNSMHELNVRTYVLHDGVPGVWFFSLDVNSEVAAAAARIFFYLPYHYANIEMSIEEKQIHYKLNRGSQKDGKFEAIWSIGDALAPSRPGSREFFLTERYCLYTAKEARLYRARIHHQPWPLHEAKLEMYKTDLFDADGLPTPEGQPVAHYAPEVYVDIWGLKEI